MKANKKLMLSIVFAGLGLLLFIAGIVFIVLFPEPEGALRVIPYLCVGLGSGILGSGVALAISYRNPEVTKRVEIEQKDERNQMINDKAKARAFSFMIYIFLVVNFLILVLMQETLVILILTGAYALAMVIYFYYLYKYNKEM